MPLAKTHGKASKIDRKAVLCRQKKGTITSISHEADYRRAEDTIDLIYADIANGVSKSECLKKLTKGDYGNNPILIRQAYHYYNAALERFATDSDIEAQKLREICFKRYEKIFEQCMKKGDLYNARATMDSICKIFGIEQKTPTTAIQINGTDDGKVVVNFGFGNQEEKKDGD